MSPTKRKPSSELSGPSPQYPEVDYVASAAGDVDYRDSAVKPHPEVDYFVSAEGDVDYRVSSVKPQTGHAIPVVVSQQQEV